MRWCERKLYHLGGEQGERQQGLFHPGGLRTGKGLFSRMLGFMFKDIEGVGPSKMNFGGIGRWMFKRMMNDKGVTPLLQLRQSAIDLGVKLQPCRMTMDVMDIKKEDLIDQVTDPVGAATYLLQAQEAAVTLLI
jgi:peroxiredoxin family protein